MLTVYKPKLEDLWFRKSFLSDPKTMAYNERYGGIIAFPEEVWEQWYERWVSHTGNDRYYRYLYDTERGSFAGEISYHLDSDENRWMADVIIPWELRGKGYGREGLRKLCSEAAKNGISVLYDSIAADNRAAVFLFTSEGFETVSKTEDIVLVRKKLQL